MATAAVVAVAVTAVVVVSTEEVSAVAVSMVVGSTGEAFAAVVLVGDVLLGATGVATGAITDSPMMSSSAATAIRVGGAGAIRTDITATAITPTITMDTAATHTATTMDTTDPGTTVGPVTDTAMAADQGISEVGDKPDYGSLNVETHDMIRQRAEDAILLPMVPRSPERRAISELAQLHLPGEPIRSSANHTHPLRICPRNPTSRGLK